MNIKFKSSRINITGGPDVLSYEQVMIDSIPDDRVLVKNKYAGVNFIDTYHRSGLYPIKLPATLGVEGGGTVADPNGTSIMKNERVVYFGDYGSYSEYSIVPANELIHVPENLDLKVAVGSLLQGLTAAFLTSFIYPVKKGDTCLVHAAAGGVGLFLVQYVKLAGAKVIATVSTEEKANIVRAMGADHAVIYTQEDFEKQTKLITEEKGVNVVFDSVGKDTFEKSLNTLAKFGLMVTFGNSSGPVPAVAPLQLKEKGSVYLVRPSLFDFKSKPEYTLCCQRLFDLLATGELKLRISLELDLKKASQAHEALESRVTYGKVILKI